MIGDIVAYNGKTWVISRQDMTSIPTGTWVLIRDDIDGLRISVSAFGGWELIKRPSFPQGFAVKWEDVPAIIQEDLGSHVLCSMDRELCTTAGTIQFNQIGSRIAKGNLVLANLHKFENQE